MQFQRYDCFHRYRFDGNELQVLRRCVSDHHSVPVELAHVDRDCQYYRYRKRQVTVADCDFESVDDVVAVADGAVRDGSVDDPRADDHEGDLAVAEAEVVAADGALGHDAEVVAAVFRHAGITLAENWTKY